MEPSSWGQYAYEANRRELHGPLSFPSLPPHSEPRVAIGQPSSHRRQPSSLDSLLTPPPSIPPPPPPAQSAGVVAPTPPANGSGQAAPGTKASASAPAAPTPGMPSRVVHSLVFSSLHPHRSRSLFPLPPPPPLPSPASTARPPSNPVLASALFSADAFVAVFRWLTEQALRAYDEAGRARTKEFLGEQLADVDMSAGREEEGEEDRTSAHSCERKARQRSARSSLRVMFTTISPHS